MKKIPHSFFNREADIVARELLGKKLCRKTENGIIRLTITETEAYMGPHDSACHSYKGRTKRTEVMHARAGTIYIYLIYGMHWMVNIVTREIDYPAAVLIRGAGNFDGPGKLTKSLDITGGLNGKMLSEKTGLWIEEGIQIDRENITTTPRIGIDYATPEWKEARLRFALIQAE